MAKTLQQIVDLLITRYSGLLTQAEAKGISVWDKKVELQQIKADLATTKADTMKGTPKPEPKAEPKTTFEERLKVTKDEDTTLPNDKKTKENKDRELNVPLAPLDNKWLEPGGIAKEDQPK